MTAKKLAAAVKQRPERFALRVVNGGFRPADGMTGARLASRKYNVGDLVFAELKRPRNPGFHKLAHALGRLFVENIEPLGHLNPHTCLKRLQLESGIGCDEIMVPAHTIWPRVVAWVGENVGQPFAVVLKASLDAIGAKATLIPVRIPRSLSFESMEQGEFQQVVAGICGYVSTTYWPSMTPTQVRQMADAMVDPA